MAEVVEFKKIVPEGKALGYLDGRACFAIGPLPGESAEVDVVKLKDSYAEAVVRRWTVTSPRRQAAAEAHYLACSPWQGVDYDYQLELKRAMLAETFGRPELEVPVLEMVGAPEQLGYRNKLEFSLKPDAAGKLALAFHERNSYEELVALPEGCVLGSAAMNAAALALLARVNTLDLAGAIETLTVRQSQTDGRCVGVVALRRTVKRDWPKLVAPELAGVVVSRLVGRSQHELVWSHGATMLHEDAGGVPLQYPFNSFFQTNVPAFRLALERIVAAVPPGSRVLDLYGGVGTIGLAVTKTAHSVVGVEVNRAAAGQAGENALGANIVNYESVAVAAERLDPKLLEGVDCVVVDPPRAGLHAAVVADLLEAAPERIVYLSCNPVTQARDVLMLKSKYRTVGVTGFDFYPGTLHLESLAVLERIKN